jgi:hypothetical protein
MSSLNNQDLTSTCNEPFNTEEILNAVKTPKNGKSVSSDLISNEVIKYGHPFSN